jgi:hypothetical protein
MLTGSFRTPALSAAVPFEGARRHQWSALPSLAEYWPMLRVTAEIAHQSTGSIGHTQMEYV